MDLAEAANLRGKIEAMFGGEHINSTEDRAVLHVATRARRDQVRWRGGTGRGLMWLGDASVMRQGVWGWKVRGVGGHVCRERAGVGSSTVDGEQEWQSC